MKFEIDIIKFLQAGRNEFFDLAFQVITMLGSVVMIVLFVLFLLKFRRKLTLWYALGYGLVLLVITILKSAVQRQRPFAVSEEVELIGSISTDFSFPSGHTACATAIAIFMGYFLFGHYKKAWQRFLIVVCLALYVGLVGLSRMYLGAHYLTDVLAGAAISAFLCTSVILALRSLDKNLGRKE